MMGLIKGLLLGTVFAALGFFALAVLYPVGPVTEPVSEPVAVPVSTPSPLPVQEATPDTAPTAPDISVKPDASVSGPATSIEIGEGSEFGRPPADQAARLPAADNGSTPWPAPAVPVAGDTPSAPQADTANPSMPEAAANDTPDSLTPPEVSDRGPSLTAPSDVELQLADAGATPAAPSPETGPAIPAAPEPTPAPEQATDDAEPAEEVRVEPAPEPAKPEPVEEEIIVTRKPVTPPPAETGGPVPAVDTPQGGIVAPAPEAEETKPGTAVARLPMAGDAPAATPEQNDPAHIAYAAPFSASSGKPLFSVILIDAGGDGLPRDALTQFPFAVTFAVKADAPDAAAAMVEYRAAGYEVLLIPGDIPQGATAKDLEVSMASYLSVLPETVAVMNPETGGFQSNRQLLQGMAAILNETGHGLVTYDRGLNAAEQVANAEGVPNALVFRQLDSDRENDTTIKRYLDRAAFKAQQDGYVIMVGHSYADTVKAIFSWALEGKAEEVELAPVSAILTR